MTGFDQRLQQLLLNVRARAEREGIEWRKADQGVFAFRAGPYVVTFSRDRDPLIAIYDEKGEEVEAIDLADLEGRQTADGDAFEDVKNRIWRLGRRGAGMSAPAMDRVLDWLGDLAEPAPAAEATDTADDGDLSAPHGDIAEPELSPQAPQAGATGIAEIAAQAGSFEPQPDQYGDQPVEADSSENTDSEQPAQEAGADSGDESDDAPASENGAMSRWTGARPPWAR